MNNKIMALAVIAVLLVGSAGTLYLVGQSNDDDEKVEPTGRLVVYGNANNDDYLDKKDLKMVESILDEDVAWDEEANPFADVNADGTVSSDDVELLKKILNKEKCTMYYLDVWGEISSIHYPITGDLGTMYWEQADLAILLGLWDRVTACGSGSLTDEKNPGWSAKYSYGKGYNVEPETVLSSNVAAVIAYTQGDGSALAIKTLIEKSGSDMDLLAPPSNDKLVAVTTYGVLLGCEERANAYVKQCDEALEYMEDKLSGYTPETAPRVIVCMVKSTTNVGDILVLGPSSTGSANGLYTYMTLTPSEIIQPTNPQSFYTSVTAEWIDSQNPDYILFSGSGIYSGLNDDEVQEVFESKCEELFGGTEAYKNGNIIATANGVMGSYFAGFAFLSLISSIYEEIDDGYAEEVWNSWVEDGYVYYSFDQMPSYKIRCLSDA